MKGGAAGQGVKSRDAGSTISGGNLRLSPSIKIKDIAFVSSTDGVTSSALPCVVCRMP
jgi:hypothetical protein